MLIGYARISKADGSQSLDLQRDALRQAGSAQIRSWRAFGRGHGLGRIKHRISARRATAQRWRDGRLVLCLEGQQIDERRLRSLNLR